MNSRVAKYLCPIGCFRICTILLFWLNLLLEWCRGCQRGRFRIFKLLCLHRWQLRQLCFLAVLHNLSERWNAALLGCQRCSGSGLKSLHLWPWFLCWEPCGILRCALGHCWRSVVCLWCCHCLNIYMNSFCNRWVWPCFCWLDLVQKLLLLLLLLPECLAYGIHLIFHMHKVSLDDALVLFLICCTEKGILFHLCLFERKEGVSTDLACQLDWYFVIPFWWSLQLHPHVDLPRTPLHNVGEILFCVVQHINQSINLSTKQIPILVV